MATWRAQVLPHKERADFRWMVDFGHDDPSEAEEIRGAHCPESFARRSGVRLVRLADQSFSRGLGTCAGCSDLSSGIGLSLSGNARRLVVVAVFLKVSPILEGVGCDGIQQAETFSIR